MSGEAIHPGRRSLLALICFLLLLLAACASPQTAVAPTPTEEERETPSPATETASAVPACDLLTTQEVGTAMGFSETTTFDEGDVCKFVAVEGGTAVFGDNVNVVSGVLVGEDLRQFAEQYGEKVGVSGEDGEPIQVEFGEEVAGLGDQA
ncbi:MAG: hypothetical protein ACRDI1_02065, partial [Actinomycetota bacterium]